MTFNSFFHCFYIFCRGTYFSFTESTVWTWKHHVDLWAILPACSLCWISKGQGQEGVSCIFLPMDFSAWVESSCDLSLLPTISIPSRGNESLLGTRSVPACVCLALSCVPLRHRQRGRGLHLLYFVLSG